LNVCDNILQQQCLLAFHSILGNSPNKFGIIFVRVREDTSPNAVRKLRGSPNGNNLILPPIYYNKKGVELSHFLAQQVIASFNSLPSEPKAEVSVKRFAAGLKDHLFSKGNIQTVLTLAVMSVNRFLRTQLATYL
jgi:hypothetical protein